MTHQMPLQDEDVRRQSTKSESCSSERGRELGESNTVGHILAECRAGVGLSLAAPAADSSRAHHAKQAYNYLLHGDRPGCLSC